MTISHWLVCHDIINIHMRYYVDQRSVKGNDRYHARLLLIFVDDIADIQCTLSLYSVHYMYIHTVQCTTYIDTIHIA